MFSQSCTTILLQRLLYMNMWGIHKLYGKYNNKKSAPPYLTAELLNIIWFSFEYLNGRIFEHLVFEFRKGSASHPPV